MARTLGVGIISTGWVAQAHAEVFSQIEDCQVVAVCSRSKQRAKAFIDERDLPAAEAYGKLDQFLAHPGLDIVVICSVHTQHPEQTIAAARAGKHIVIEKPVALNRKDLAAMVREVKKANVKTSVCFELRWIGLFKNIKAMMKQKLIGDVFYGETAYFHGIGPDIRQHPWNIKKRMAGSAEITAGCHAIDALVWLMGSDVVEVSAMSTRSKANPFQYEYDPNSVAIMKFENGAIGKVATSIECRQPYLFPVLLQGTNGTIHDDKISTLDWPGLHKDKWAQVPCDLPNSGDVHDHPYEGQLRYFVECVRNNRRPHNDLAHTAHAHEVCFAIQEAIKSRKTVKVKKTLGT